MGQNAEFIGVIRAAVDADPGNVGLRIDLIELLLDEDPAAAAAEISGLATLGANDQTVQVLRARAAAAMLRAGRATSEPQAVPPRPPMPPVPPAPASTSESLPETPPRQPAVGEPVPVARADADGDERVIWDVERPQITLADVAGLQEVKDHLEAAFLAPLRNPDLARMFGKSARGSLLMYGPPGCGKTFIARAIAGELGAGLIHATLADIMGQYFGQSEKAIHELFQRARESRPCVIFFDEFDALGGRRTSGGASAQSLRMITSQLLEEFDGVGADNDGVYVLAATNRPWDIDPALRRPGRLDRTVLILPPDQPAREAIIARALRDKPAAAVDAAGVAARIPEFSGADITHVVETAVQSAFVESLRSGVPRMIATHDLEQAARTIVPSTRSWFEQIKPVLEYGVDDGTFAQLRAYLKRHRI